MWTDQEGNYLEIKYMTDDHIVGILNMFNGSLVYDFQAMELDDIKREAEKRGILVECDFEEIPDFIDEEFWAW